MKTANRHFVKRHVVTASRLGNLAMILVALISTGCATHSQCASKHTESRRVSVSNPNGSFSWVYKPTLVCDSTVCDDGYHQDDSGKCVGNSEHQPSSNLMPSKGNANEDTGSSVLMDDSQKGN